MLAVVTHDGTSLIDPTGFKQSSSSFPTSTPLECSMSSWSPDNSQLYLATSSSIKRYTPSECLLEELYHGSDIVTCLAMKNKNDLLFFASGDKVWSLDCTRSPGKVLLSLEPHKNTITKISICNDGTLLASVSASAVFVHNLTLSSHVQLKGLSARKPVTCCLFHQHSKTRLLLGVGKDVVVYDAARPFNPLKSIRVPGGGDIVDIAASPFSKTLVASVTSEGDVALVDLDKDNGILKTVNVKTSLTCCAFTAEGAAIYLGTESGKLLILDLRSLEKEPKSFVIGDGNAPLKLISVQGKPKFRQSTSTNSAKSTSSVAVRSSPRSVRTVSATSVAGGPGVKSPPRVTVSSKILGGGGVTPKRKLFPSIGTPLCETKNLALDTQLVALRSPTLSHRMKTSKLQRSKEKEVSLSRTSRGLPEPTNARQNPKLRQYNEHLGLGSAPESISGHMAAMRVRSGPPSNNGVADEENQPVTMRRIISESIEGRKGRAISTSSGQSRVSSLRSTKSVAHTQHKQHRVSTMLDNSDGHLDLPSPELPREPVTPISLGKNTGKASMMRTADSRALRLTSPEPGKWFKEDARKGKGKEETIEVKLGSFAQGADTGETSGASHQLRPEGDTKVLTDEGQVEEQEQLSLQVSPRRPTAPPVWLPSPRRLTGVNYAAQEFLRNIVQDVMYDFQRESKAEMMNLHLDLVRMSRGWKQELREAMEEWKGEMEELRTENKRLREENERLRRSN